MIELTGVSKSYGAAVVVNDVSLTLPAGGVTAMIGPNGAGKSTLLSMIARLTPMSSGRITVGGLDVSKAPGDILARKLAILRQDNHVAPRLTVRDLVAFGRYPHSKGWLTAQDENKVTAAIGYMGLETLERRFLDELSGGQRQRAFVAMVLAQDTEYLLLDEPLNNLDMKHASAMMKLVRNAADELGKSVVVVLHDINFASCHADRIVAMKDGRIAFHGSPEEIMREDVLEELYETRIAVRVVDGMRLGLYYS